MTDSERASWSEGPSISVIRLLDHPAGSPVDNPAPTYARFAGTSLRLTCPMPKIGSDTRAILRELGHDDAQIEHWIAAGVAADTCPGRRAGDPMLMGTAWSDRQVAGPSGSVAARRGSPRHPAGRLQPRHGRRQRRAGTAAWARSAVGTVRVRRPTPKSRLRGRRVHTGLAAAEGLRFHVHGHLEAVAGAAGIEPAGQRALGHQPQRIRAPLRAARLVSFRGRRHLLQDRRGGVRCRHPRTAAPPATVAPTSPHRALTGPYDAPAGAGQRGRDAQLLARGAEVEAGAPVEPVGTGTEALAAVARK